MYNSERVIAIDSVDAAHRHSSGAMIWSVKLKREHMNWLDRSSLAICLTHFMSVQQPPRWQWKRCQPSQSRMTHIEPDFTHLQGCNMTGWRCARTALVLVETVLPDGTCDPASALASTPLGPSKPTR